jgi:hypothetical protein
LLRSGKVSSCFVAAELRMGHACPLPATGGLNVGRERTLWFQSTRLVLFLHHPLNLYQSGLGIKCLLSDWVVCFYAKWKFRNSASPNTIDTLLFMCFYASFLHVWRLPLSALVRSRLAPLHRNAAMVKRAKAVKNSHVCQSMNSPCEKQCCLLATMNTSDRRTRWLNRCVTVLSYPPVGTLAGGQEGPRRNTHGMSLDSEGVIVIIS